MHLLRRKWHMSRRACLRGLSATLALPMLDAMRPLKVSAADAAPKRFFTVFVPHGIDMPSWTPTLPSGRTRRDNFVDAAYVVADKRALAPLASLRANLTVISGLGNAPANKGDFNGSHARGTGTALTCSELKTTSDFSQIQNGVSLDQLIASRVGTNTPFPSLELGVRSGDLDGDCEDGYSCAYINNISWSGPAQPAPKQTSPRDVFDRLIRFYTPPSTAPSTKPPAVDPARRYDESILLHMREDATQLHALLGREDRQRMEEYLNGVRELERRLSDFGGGEGGGVSCFAPGAPADPASYEEHVRLMMDMVVFAFRCDLTRVATFMMENPFNSRDYNFIDVSGNSHEISHHGGDADKLESIRRINAWQSERVAELLNQMAAIDEGEGSLLDNSLVYYTSEFGDGDDHYHHDLPVLLAGSLGGAFSPGRHIHYGGPVGGGLGAVEQSTPLANLYLSILRGFGMNDSAFGDNGSMPLSEV